MEPTLVVFSFASLAAIAAALGVLPLAGGRDLPLQTLGWAHALAAGAMLGAAFVLMMASLDAGVSAPGLGAALGISVVWFSHLASGTGNLDLGRLDVESELYGYQVLLVNALHSASEGVAIGAAAMVSLPFGVFLALAMAAHNIPEATAQSAVLRARGVRLRHAAGLAVFTNVPQILLAVVTFALVRAAPELLPWSLGFAFGALVYLVMAEHLPESYRKAGHTT
ncbi:MAG: ZIP family metal transporter, partial [Gemmatimonadota bacterium]|nr:ZIP family metal transporter [Gemmatimonadota bacterium]